MKRKRQSSTRNTASCRNRAGKLQGHPADEVLQCLQHRPDRFCRKAARTLRAHEEGGATRRLFGRNDLRGVGRACLSANWYCPIKGCSIRTVPTVRLFRPYHFAYGVSKSSRRERNITHAPARDGAQHGKPPTAEPHVRQLLRGCALCP